MSPMPNVTKFFLSIAVLNSTLNQAGWCVTVIPALWVVEARRSQGGVQPDQFGDFGRSLLCVKKKKNKMFEDIPIVHCGDARYEPQ